MPGLHEHCLQPAARFALRRAAYEGLHGLFPFCRRLWLADYCTHAANSPIGIWVHPTACVAVCRSTSSTFASTERPSCAGAYANNTGSAEVRCAETSERRELLQCRRRRSPHLCKCDRRKTRRKCFPFSVDELDYRLEQQWQHSRSAPKQHVWEAIVGGESRAQCERAKRPCWDVATLTYCSAPSRTFGRSTLCPSLCADRYVFAEHAAKFRSYAELKPYVGRGSSTEIR